jgi:DNA helicase-2/ATP-dependent DNA helicase PcrA
MPLDPSLNPEQRRAVETVEGPVLIVAGAGSGKTKTLTHRVAYLMQKKGIRARNILAVTFTNKAAEEMRTRVMTLLSAVSSQQSAMSKTLTPYSSLPTTLPHIGTFHSICARILRKDIAALGYKPTFTILDSDDQLSLMKRVMKSLEIDPKNIHPRALLDTVSRAKNQLVDELVFESQAGSHFEELVAKAYRRYQEELRGNHALDFDDLLGLTIRLFREYPETLERYRALFRYILVDEYQDTNHSQYTLIHLLAERHRNLFAIGDDYQSIYGWRQADIRNILNFEKDYPEATIVTLDQNYRSTQVILDAAGTVIAQNPNQRHKKLWTAKTGGEPLTVFEAEDEQEESEYVVRTIQSLTTKKQLRFSDFAVLYRTNAQSRALEETCLKHSLPYKIVGGLKFYQRKEIKDAISYLRLVANNWDTLSLARIVNEPSRGIGKKSLVSWLDTAKTAQTDPIALAREDDGKRLALAPSKQKSAARFAKTICEYTQKLPQEGALSSFLRELLETVGYLKSLDDGTDEGKTRLENVQELFSVTKKYDTISLEHATTLFLEEISLVSDTDALDEQANVVHLMTLHSAKGLEFPFVFIVGLEEGIFPHSRSALSPAELEEERRLMYVGLTRAKEKAWLVSAETRMIFGSTQMNAPSRFISEIPEHLVEYEERKKGRENSEFSDSSLNRSASSKKHSSFETRKKAKSDTLRPGDSVAHPTFGNGVVIKIEGTLATIAFRTKGIKKLALGIAPLERT